VNEKSDKSRLDLLKNICGVEAAIRFSSFEKQVKPDHKSYKKEV
jgi:hypothetical protein